MATKIVVPPTGEGYCECCGRPMQEIKNELAQVAYDANGRRQVGKHYQIQCTHAIYDDNYLRNCKACGKELDTEKDIQVEHEFMGYCGSARATQAIITGYTCHHCGHHEEF